MKRLALLLVLVSPTMAGEVKLVWDPNPPQDLVQAYIVYEHVDHKTYTPMATVTTNAVTLTGVPVGEHCYVVTASNFWGESVFSNEACTRVLVNDGDDPDYVDMIPPVSGMYGLPAESEDSFEVSWWGLDELGGAGISYYDIYVAVDGGSFGIWLTGTGMTQAYYDGMPGHDYAFYVVAVDRAGNRGATPDEAQAWTRAIMIDDEAPMAGMDGLPEFSYPAFEVSWWGVDFPGGSGVKSYDVYVRDNGGGWQLWLGSTATTGGTYLGVLGHIYAFAVVAIDQAGNRSPLPLEPMAFTHVTLLNAAPRLETPLWHPGGVDQLLVITNRATDPDLPGQTLTFSLVSAGAPGAVMNPGLGTLTWTPTLGHAGKSVPFDVMVTDNGYPPLSAMQRITVRVDHYLQIGLGTNVVKPGQLGVMPVTVYSSAAIGGMYVRFKVRPDSALKEWKWIDAPGGGCSGLLWVEDASTIWLVFQDCPASLFPGLGLMGHLQFQASATFEGLVRMEVDQVWGLDSNLAEITDLGVFSGRLAVMDEAPVLDLVRNKQGNPSLVLYGRAGRHYELETRSSGLVNPAWIPLGRILLNRDVQTLGMLGLTRPDAMFRVRVLVAD